MTFTWQNGRFKTLQTLRESRLWLDFHLKKLVWLYFVSCKSKNWGKIQIVASGTKYVLSSYLWRTLYTQKGYFEFKNLLNHERRFSCFDLDVPGHLRSQPHQKNDRWRCMKDEPSSNLRLFWKIFVLVSRNLIKMTSIR